ncbi:FAD-dependent monooxygenase [Nocardia sp. NBC_01499]|uniref:NAD(P)/FAD-dependent oxidoreductase n=1 Tax=Nocardia sp. NBC_01499 TaxID=2903597 RepID=UPI003863F41B
MGGGIGGLLAARVLADYFDRVTVLEQDQVSADTEYRSGIPQARHPHGLLARGARILEELFPGIRTELAEMGAPVFDYGELTLVMLPTGWAPRRAIGQSVQTCTRVALERCIRRRVMALPGVTIRGGFRVEDLCWNAARSRVTGVCGRPRKASPTSPGPAETIEADLVIDASGRTSKLPHWLSEAGFSPPVERVVDGNLSYTSRLYDSPPDINPDWTLTGEVTYAPAVRRGGGIAIVESGHWIVCLIGAGGEPTPTDEAGFLDYARSLHNPHIASSITDATPAGALYRFVKLANRWTPYHQMRRWPDRLLCLGDAVCILNPVQGQGMTVAAIQATILSDLLDRRDRTANLTGLGRQFQRRAARSLRLPWLMAASADLAWNPTHAGLSARLAHWYFDQLLQLLPTDPDTYRRVMLTGQMINNPLTLLHPRVLARLARHRGRRIVVSGSPLGPDSAADAPR